MLHVSLFIFISHQPLILFGFKLHFLEGFSIFLVKSCVCQIINAYIAVYFAIPNYLFENKQYYFTHFNLIGAIFKRLTNRTKTVMTTHITEHFKTRKRICPPIHAIKHCSCIIKAYCQLQLSSPFHFTLRTQQINRVCFANIGAVIMSIK